MSLDRKAMSAPLCFCMKPSSFGIAKNGDNKGKKYYQCYAGYKKSCKFFKWDTSSDDKHQSSYPSIVSRSTNERAIEEGSIVAYTDGACKGNAHVKDRILPAGWGAAIIYRDESGERRSPVELCGPVVTDPAEKGYLGAKVTSNNTAELSGIGEALKHILSVPPSQRRNVTVCCDSEYAEKSVRGDWNGEKNRELIENIRKILRQVEKHSNVEIILVKGHSGDRYNNLADELANQGSRGIRRYAEASVDPRAQSAIVTPSSSDTDAVHMGTKRVRCVEDDEFISKKLSP